MGDPVKLSDIFADFFSQKIIHIRSNLHVDLMEKESVLPESTCTPLCQFTSFDSLNVYDVTKLVKKMPSKTCSIDPMPTNLVKECLDVLAPFLVRIVNCSFDSGIFPHHCKEAIIRPLIKKVGLDTNDLKTFRPVSNCSFLDRFLEKAALKQLHDYFQDNSLYGKFQSAYREGHSTETALLRVHNDVMCALDRQKDLILVMLDLPAAFDTIDHDILMHRLRTRFGIGGKVFDWLNSFLRGRTQRVRIGSTVSKAHELQFGVPQGSVLGPVLFSLYMVPLEHIINRHGLNSVIYADDSQLYVACDSRTDFTVVSRIETCVNNEIRHWMGENMLALNDAKTEIIWFSSRFKEPNLRVLANAHVKVGSVCISTSDTVRNLGVIFDSAGTMNSHITNVCKTASYSLWRIGKLRRLLDQSSIEKLIHAFITSKLVIVYFGGCMIISLGDYSISKTQHDWLSGGR